MNVVIKTENGLLEVNLAEFFPTSLVRTRKLFRLMEQGLGDSEKENVREYLRQRGNKDRIAEERHAEEDRIQNAVEELEAVKQKRNRLEQIIRVAKAKVRILEQEEKNAQIWIREFDYICGGPENR